MRYPIVFFLNIFIFASVHGQSLETETSIRLETVGYRTNEVKGLFRADSRINLNIGWFSAVAQPRVEVSSFASREIMDALWEDEERYLFNFHEAYFGVDLGVLKAKIGKQTHQSSLIDGPRRPAAWTPVDLLDPLEWERIAVPSVRVRAFDLLQAWYSPGNTVSRIPKSPWRLSAPISIRGDEYEISGRSYGIRTQFYRGDILIGVGIQHAPNYAPKISVRRISRMARAGQLSYLHNPVDEAFVQTSFPLAGYTVEAEGALVYESDSRYLSYVVSLNRIWKIGYFGDTITGEIQYIGEVGDAPVSKEKVLDFRRNLQETIVSRITYSRGRFEYRFEGAVTVVDGGGFILRPSIGYESGNLRLSFGTGVLGGSERVFFGRFGGSDHLRISVSYSL